MRTIPPHFSGVTMKQFSLQAPKGTDKKLLYGLWTSLFIVVIIGMTNVPPHFLSKVKWLKNIAECTWVRIADCMFLFSPEIILK